MSGFETAGVVLGGLPIAWKVAENYKEGMAPLVKWYKFEDDFVLFVNDVRLEYQTFKSMCSRLLGYTILPQTQREVLVSGMAAALWKDSEVQKALRQALGPWFKSCVHLFDLIEKDLRKLQKILSIKNGSVSAHFQDVRQFPAN